MEKRVWTEPQQQRERQFLWKGVIWTFSIFFSNLIWSYVIICGHVRASNGDVLSVCLLDPIRVCGMKPSWHRVPSSRHETSEPPFIAFNSLIRKGNARWVPQSTVDSLRETANLPRIAMEVFQSDDACNLGWWLAIGSREVVRITCQNMSSNLGLAMFFWATHRPTICVRMYEVVVVRWWNREQVASAARAF